MSSSTCLVSEVLAAAGHEEDFVKSQFHEIKHKLDDINAEIFKLVSCCYDDLCSVYTDVDDLSSELNHMLKQCDDTSQMIETLKPQLSTVVHESDKLFQESQKAIILTDVLKVLLEINIKFKDYDVQLQEEEFHNAVLTIVECEDILKGMKHSFVHNLDIVSIINKEFVIKKERLKFELGKMWNKSYIWKSENDNLLHKLSIYGASETSQEKAVSFLKTLAYMNMLDHHLKVFATRLLNYFIKPILNKAVTLKISKNMDFLYIEFTQSSSNVRIKPSTDLVFNNLILLFNSLNDLFLNINVTIPSSKEEMPVAKALGKLLSDDFCQALLSEGILDRKGTTENESLSTITECATNLQNLLVGMKFLECDSNAFGHTQNFNSIISNQMCQEIFSIARKTMKKEIHKTIIVNPLIPTLRAVKQESDSEELTDLQNHHINEALQFPECAISSFIIEILEQLKGIFQEASKGTSLTAPRLYFAARYIVEMFCDIVPIYHQHDIAMFPHQTAIHHNNCMYLAHELIIQSHSWKSVESLMRQEATNDEVKPIIAYGVIMSFADLSYKLKHIGTSAFLAQMRRQKQQLLEFLQDGTVFRNLATVSDFLVKGKRSLQQCLHQLNSLRDLWINVLPPDVFLKAIGTLCNSVVEEIIFQVSSQEDITEKVTEQLGTLFEMLLTDMPSLFKVEKYESISELSLCQKHVSRWTKFQELKLLIVSSLREIVDRWAEGRGPLAMVFTPEEVKQLIRALFQNTDRRSVALAKIIF